MIRTQVYIPDDLHRDLMLLAKQEGTNFSTLIREGVAEVVKKKRITQRKKDWRKFVGAGRTNVKTDAVKIFHKYYTHWKK